MLLMGMVVEAPEEDVLDHGDKVSIKFLGVPGDSGPKIILTRGDAEQLVGLINEYLKTGKQQVSLH